MRAGNRTGSQFAGPFPTSLASGGAVIGILDEKLPTLLALGFNLEGRGFAGRSPLRAECCPSAETGKGGVVACGVNSHDSPIVGMILIMPFFLVDLCGLGSPGGGDSGR